MELQRAEPRCSIEQNRSSGVGGGFVGQGMQAGAGWELGTCSPTPSPAVATLVMDPLRWRGGAGERLAPRGMQPALWPRGLRGSYLRAEVADGSSGSGGISQRGLAFVDPRVCRSLPRPLGSPRFGASSLTLFCSRVPDVALMSASRPRLRLRTVGITKTISSGAGAVVGLYIVTVGLGPSTEASWRIFMKFSMIMEWLRAPLFARALHSSRWSLRSFKNRTHRSGGLECGTFTAFVRVPATSGPSVHRAP